jgi:hypothetical protein
MPHSQLLWRAIVPNEDLAPYWNEGRANCLSLAVAALLLRKIIVSEQAGDPRPILRKSRAAQSKQERDFLRDPASELGYNDNDDENFFPHSRHHRCHQHRTEAQLNAYKRSDTHLSSSQSTPSIRRG